VPTGRTVPGLVVLLYDSDGDVIDLLADLSEEVKSLLKLQISAEQTVFIR